MECIFQNIKGKDCELYMSHDLPIPDCFNKPLNKALLDDPELIWFVEEDMYLPSNTLDKMVELYEAGNLVISSEYADRRTGRTLVTRNSKGEVLYSGMGCLLIHNSVLRKMEEPIIRTGVFWLKDDDYEYHPELTAKGYGTQDVYLSWKIREQGHKIVLVDMDIGHLSLIEKSEDIINNGQHKIETVYIKK